MMDELSLNILDIAQNSIAANATLIEIDIEENDSKNTLIIRVKDNGKGMDEDFLKKVEDPFITTRTTRKTGLGISFFKEAAEMTGGSIEIESKPSVGTTITGHFTKDHIDRQPIGDIAGTIMTLVSLNTGVDFEVKYRVNENEFLFSTKEAKDMLGEDSELNKPAIVNFLTEYLSEHINALHD
jgi:anti-sigma regulatory factor (Ser/Thr protein kinase)